MQKTFNKALFPNLKRIAQKTNSHCGPAVLEMLASFLDVNIDQDQFVEVLGIVDKLPTYGMTIQEMAEAVNKLLPNLQFWYKNNSSLNDLSQLVNYYHYPVGVEWQGVFYEEADEDNGHYSIITQIDTTDNIISIADPYKRFAGTDRIFHILEFEDRWWDENEIKDPYTGKMRLERDYHAMFILTSKEEIFPESLGMTRG